MASLWTRLRDGLARTKAQLADEIDFLLKGQALTPEVMENLEESLIRADVGVEATQRILDALEEGQYRGSGGNRALAAMRSAVRDILAPGDHGLIWAESGPTVTLVIGVNGVGKTTTIGKLAARSGADGKRVVIGAADTFRAAADDQLAIWSDRAKAEIVRHQKGADSAAVAYAAVERGLSIGADLVLIDTAGRLHTKKNLMEELRKIKRVVAKHDPAFPHEILLVIDATTGQNALQQAKVFNEALQITGIALTKLDSTARGGIVLAVAQELRVPVKLIGVGEALEDLQEFDPDAFADALLGIER